MRLSALIRGRKQKINRQTTNKWTEQTCIKKCKQQDSLSSTWVQLANSLQCLVVWANTFLDVSVKAFCRCEYIYSQLTLNKWDYPRQWVGPSNQLKAIRAKPEVSRRRDFASRLQHRNPAWVSSLLTCPYRFSSPHNPVSQFLKISFSLWLMLDDLERQTQPLTSQSFIIERQRRETTDYIITHLIPRAETISLVLLDLLKHWGQGCERQRRWANTDWGNGTGSQEKRFRCQFHPSRTDDLRFHT